MICQRGTPSPSSTHSTGVPSTVVPAAPTGSQGAPNTTPCWISEAVGVGVGARFESLGDASTVGATGGGVFAAVTGMGAGGIGGSGWGALGRGGRGGGGPAGAAT